MSVSFPNIADRPAPVGKDILVPVAATDSGGQPITYSVTSNSSAVSASVITGGRSLRLNISGTDRNSQPFSGDLVLRLFEDLAPITTARIIELAQNGFYNNLTFHRVLDNFVLQGGDPSGNGSGGTGMKFSDELNRTMTFTSPGLLAMANSGDDTNDSQFFITDIDVPLSAMPEHLNFNHTIFGQLVSGFTTYASAIGTPVSGSGGLPTNPLRINSATVFTDTQNGVLRVKTSQTSASPATLTVTAVGGGGESASTSFFVTPTADTKNDRPFLGPLSDLSTVEGAPVSFSISPFDAEGDNLVFAVSNAAPGKFNEPPPNVALSFVPENLTVTITPAPGFSGTVEMLVGVRDSTNRVQSGSINSQDNFDTQLVRLTVRKKADVPAQLREFSGPDDVFAAGPVNAGGSQIVLLNSNATAADPGVSVLNAITGEQVGGFQTDFTGWTDVSDRTLIGDVDGDGDADLIQINRPIASGGALNGNAIRTIDIKSGNNVSVFSYDTVPTGETQNLRSLLTTLVDPEDAVFVGRFSANGDPDHLQILFFNRTSQATGAASLRVFDLITGAMVDSGVHNGLNFGGWIDATDEITVSDTNGDDLDDLVFINRVIDPINNRSTNLGFVGMVSLATNSGGRNGTNIGFYRFFNWNFAKPGENNVFPGYDDLADRATFGHVINNSKSTPVITLINSSSTTQAAYALLEPAPLVQGVPDSFQLISTVFHGTSTSGSFDSDDPVIMADVNNDGSDEILSYSKGSGGFKIKTFGSFSGQVLGDIPGTASSRPTTIAQSSPPLVVGPIAGNSVTFVVDNEGASEKMLAAPPTALADKAEPAAVDAALTDARRHIAGGSLDDDLWV